jgi:hypothetical protein
MQTDKTSADNAQQAALVEDENVVAYFGSMETAESDLVGNEAANEEEDEDFS